MPLTAFGKSQKRKFIARHGKRGERIFFATINSRPAFKRKVEA